MRAQLDLSERALADGTDEDIVADGLGLSIARIGRLVISPGEIWV